MRRLCGILGALGAAVLVAAASIAALLLRDGISARSPPSPLEVRIARTLRHLAIPAAARAATNPVPAGPQPIAAGLAHFADHCAICHANDGGGGTAIGRALYPRAPDLRLAATQSLPDGELFFIIENGVRLTGMPAWGEDGDPDASWRLVHFIRHLPEVTAEELARMEALNPKTPEALRAREAEDAFLRGEGPPPEVGGAHGH